MHIKFNKLTIHNFLSFGDVELTLSDKGYCKVSGVNKNPRDAALSNGSGKSSLISAICWVLTGETIQGISKNIKNINLNGGCWVKLDFKVDNKEYSITRYKDFENFGSDLKIIIDGEDKSGKGIRESESLLSQYLPDLSSDLIGNVILLGQGLPHKFANNTPAERKKLLEKLSRSDFMLEDIKSRLIKEESRLNSIKRDLDDKSIAYVTESNITKHSLEKVQTELDSMNQERDFDSELLDIETKLSTQQTLKDELQVKILNYTAEKSKVDAEYKTVLSSIYAEKQEIVDEFSECSRQYYEKTAEIKSKIQILKKEIANIESIKDICPTCGQKIPNVTKPDYSRQINEVAELKQQLDEVDTLYAKYKLDNDIKLKELTNRLSTIEQPFRDKLSKLDKDIKEAESARSTAEANILSFTSLKIKTKSEKDSFDTLKSKLSSELVCLQNQLNDTQAKILYINNENIKLNEHINVVNKFNTLIKRDFRGFLLSSIIEFINQKAKEYAEDLFGANPDFNVKLDGNNIDISYCKKPYENLSGGEKQKVDLIMQFAIRDMMSQYLDFSSNCLFLDEILDNLDMIGCTNVLNLVSHKLSDVESIFVISHHSDLDIPYDNTIIIEKDKNGVSRIR